MANLKLPTLYFSHLLICRTTRLRCLLPRLPVEHSFDIAKLRQPNPEWLKFDAAKKGPTGQVPVLEDGDVKIGQSHAIMHYLVRIPTEGYDGRKNYYPSKRKIKGILDLLQQKQFVFCSIPRADRRAQTNTMQILIILPRGPTLFEQISIYSLKGPTFFEQFFLSKGPRCSEIARQIRIYGINCCRGTSTIHIMFVLCDYIFDPRKKGVYLSPYLSRGPEVRLRTQPRECFRRPLV